MGSWKFISEVIGISLIVILVFLVYVLLRTVEFGFNNGIVVPGG